MTTIIRTLSIKTLVLSTLVLGSLLFIPGNPNYILSRRLFAIIFFLIFGFFTPSIVSADTAHTTQWNWISSSDNANGPNDGNYVALAVFSPIWYIPGTGWNIPSNATITSMDVYTYTTGNSYAIWLEGNPGNACGEAYGTRLHTFTGANCSMTFTPANMNDGTTIYMHRWIFENFNVDAVKVRINYTTPEITPSPSPTPSVSPTPAPFLDLPWDYQAKGKTFNDAALAINSYFDHEYPLQSRGKDFPEPATLSATLVPFSGFPRGEGILGLCFKFCYSGHDGYDYGSLEAGVGKDDAVYPAAPGTAEYKYSNASGNMIYIDHHNYYQTRYYHLRDKGIFEQKPDEKKEVDRNTVIGYVGSTGIFSNGAHIHFSVFQDKDKDGDFNDEEPFGVTDPFGWQPEEKDKKDPWETYKLLIDTIEYTGNKSNYLWTKMLSKMEQDILPTGVSINIEDYKMDFPLYSVDYKIKIKAHSSPYIKTEIEGIKLKSILPALTVTGEDELGNPFTQFLKPFALIVDFSKRLLFNIKPGTLYIYSSQDGNVWIKETTTIDPDKKIATAYINHLTQFALMGEIADTTSPATKIELAGTKGQNNYFKSDVTLSLQATDKDDNNNDGIGVSYILYKLPDEDWKTYETSLVFNNEGKYRIQFYSVDKGGNVEDVKTTEFSIDTTPPTTTHKITGTKGNNDWYVSDVSVTLTASDEASGIAVAKYSLDNGSTYQDYTDTINISTEESKNLLYYSQDKAGNIENAKNLEIKIDKTAPDTLLYASGNKGDENWYNTNVEISLNGTDAVSGYKTTYYSFDEDADKKFEEYLNPLTIDKEETTKIYYYSEDIAGNKENTQMKEIKIDKTAPIASINASPATIWPPNGKMVNVKITGNSSDNHLKNTTFKVEDEYGFIEPALTGFGQTIELQAKRNGDDKDGRSYTIQATAEDLAGNKSIGQTKVIVPHDQGK